MAVRICGTRKRHFSADEYQLMGRVGILFERVELIAGEVVAMTSIGPRHNAAVNRATRARVPESFYTVMSDWKPKFPPKKP
jgi:hypothetical protein